MASLLQTERASKKGKKIKAHNFCEQITLEKHFRHFPTFVVEDAFHFYAAAGVSDAEGGTGHQTLQGGRAVRGAHQAPVGFIVEPLQDLHRLSPPHCQLIAVTAHEVVDHYRQLTATRQLRKRKIQFNL